MNTTNTRKIWLLLVAAAALAALALLPGAASAQSPLVFGIQPSQSSANTPSGSSYFTYTLAPGAGLDDMVVISNNGAEQVILNLYAADGITSINGSTAFAAAGDIRTNTNTWLNATALPSVSPCPAPPNNAWSWAGSV